jgi:hypothetical protein
VKVTVAKASVKVRLSFEWLLGERKRNRTEIGYAAKQNNMFYISQQCCKITNTSNYC